MPTPKETITAYNKYAEKWFMRREKGLTVAHDFLEKPAMYSKVPELTGKSVLCIGCGTGEECFSLMSKGAQKVVGVDISKELIRIAMKNYPELEFYVMDMENLSFPEESFDFVYSSLVMHYVEDWTPVLKSIRRVLRQNGKFLFSTHHPAVWGGERTRDKDTRTSLLGYVKHPNEGKYKIYGDYLNTRKIEDTWYDDFDVSYYHKSFSSIMRDIIASGFRIVDVLEPKAISETKNKYKMFWEIREKIPLFIIFELQK